MSGPDEPVRHAIPATTLESHYPHRRLLAEFEGGAIWLAESSDHAAVITDEGTLGGLHIRDWSPQPGGIDLYVEDDGGPMAVIELKIYSVDQVLWDIYKLLAADLPDSVRRYVVAAAPAKRFTHKTQGGALFTTDSPPWIEYTARMLNRWAKAWENLLAGGPARPQSAPNRITIQPTFSAPMRNVPGYELRAIEVRPAEFAMPIPFRDGWPV
jgi:hypothetical protein